ncbi:uncharacterized protein BXZ73DRAFT_103083 [Epithele typhae]|uniref:uncharacterized protein n=1 Tax=Epithele typhae TaxID=378194 RepID=UPI002008783C|nr:uncharacterized protein BXZ73DRAFT_103083 [Epithele typhae]KAH9925913.1 hypothetical protein BXZ73DRAFT_103083 [Epithele typhae]
MRTRRRPALKDKTPGNTPQKPKPTSAKPLKKPKTVPVVEIKVRPRRGKQKQPEDEEKDGRMDAVEERGDEVTDASPPATALSSAAEVRAHLEETKEDKTNARSTRLRSRTTRKDAQLKASSDAEDAENGPPPRDLGAQALRVLPPPDTPTVARVPLRPARHVPVPAAAATRAHVDAQHPHTHSHIPAHAPTPLSPRPATPESIPIADDDSTASDAVRAILATPSPARLVRPPIGAQATPLGKLPPLAESFKPFYVRGRHENSIRKWTAKVVGGASAGPHSPLPPSSPVVASSSQQVALPPPVRYRGSWTGEARTEAIYAERKESDESDEDDPFGLLATTTKGKAQATKTTVPWWMPSAALVPKKVPTPLPSDDSQFDDNDLYLDVDPAPPTSRLEFGGDEEDMEENGDKENEPDWLQFDDTENAALDVEEENDENAPPPPPPNDPHAAANTSAPLLARPEALALLLAEPSPSPTSSEERTPSTPHKLHVHQHPPLPSPAFSASPSDEGLDLAEWETHRTRPRPRPPLPHAGPSIVRPAVRQPLATLELEPEEPPSPVEREEKESGPSAQSSDSDPRNAVRRLEALLPKRSKTRAGDTASSSPSTAGEEEGQREGEGEAKAKVRETRKSARAGPSTVTRGRKENVSVVLKGKGKEREREVSVEESTSADGESGSDDTSPPRPPPAGVEGQGKAREEEIDPEEDEERARKRQERLEYFRKLDGYSLEKEDVYVV